MSRGQYPSTRMRRNRTTAFSRRLVAEIRLDTADLIWPLFVIEGQNIAEPIDVMPGVFRYSIDQLLQQAAKAVQLTIPAIAIFPSIDAALKDETGSLARDGNNLVCRAVSAVKAAFPDLGIICDVALDPFTSHGHDGLLGGDEILNDETIAVLCEQAVHQANAGFWHRKACRFTHDDMGAMFGKTSTATHNNTIAKRDNWLAKFGNRQINQIFTPKKGICLVKTIGDDGFTHLPDVSTSAKGARRTAGDHHMANRWIITPVKQSPP